MTMQYAARLHRKVQGFTLVELMVVVAVVALLTSIAVPSYFSYVQRSRVPVGLDALQSYFARMEQRFQDVGSYANGAACAVSLPNADNYAMNCSLSGGGSGFTATATGNSKLAGYAYTINHNGVRTTTAHPKGLPGSNCWSIRGGSCDM